MELEQWGEQAGRASIHSHAGVDIDASARPTDSPLVDRNGGQQAVSEPDVMPELVSAQRALRDSLLRRGGLVRADLRDLAAHLLLYLDEPSELFAVVLDWLARSLNADRADAGFIVFGTDYYQPTKECIRPEFVAMPSISEARFDLNDPSLQLIMRSSIPVVFDDVTTDGRTSASMRCQLDHIGVRRKLTMALRPTSSAIGLICLDRGVDAPSWTPTVIETFGTVVEQILNPILGPIAGSRDVPPPGSSPSFQPAALTSAEKRVAQLVLSGCSYKEIASRLGRSPSTIDHQLRSLREKLGVHSTPKLINALRQQSVQLADVQD